METARDSRAGNRTRELSPYSARRALTARNGRDGDDFGAPPQPARNPRNGSPRTRRGMRRSTSRSRSRSRDRGAKSNSEALTKGTRRSRSRSRDRTQRERLSDRSKPFDDPPEESTMSRARDSSPEPFKNPPASSKGGRRDRSRDRRRDRSRERRRDRSRDRRGSGSRDRNKDRSRDRSRDRRRKDRSRDRSKDRSRERRRDRSRQRSRDRSREKTRDRSRDRKRKDRDRSRSPLPFRSNKRQDRSRSPLHRSKKPLPSQEVSFRGLDDSAQPPSKYGGAPPTKEKPNFKTTGLLAKAANRVEGTKISLKYHEPPEARKPPASQPWRMFVFKGDDVVDTIELHTKSCWLLGRSHEVVDYVLEHPSSSGQHAVVQFRYIQKITEDEFGVKQKKGKVKPYIIDLESSNGTELNGKPIETSRYFELRDKDILKFAGSEREYVVMLPPPE